MQLGPALPSTNPQQTWTSPTKSCNTRAASDESGGNDGTKAGPYWFIILVGDQLWTTPIELSCHSLRWSQQAQEVRKRGGSCKASTFYYVAFQVLLEYSSEVASSYLWRTPLIMSLEWFAAKLARRRVLSLNYQPILPLTGQLHETAIPDGKSEAHWNHRSHSLRHYSQCWLQLWLLIKNIWNHHPVHKWNSDNFLLGDVACLAKTCECSYSILLWDEVSYMYLL